MNIIQNNPYRILGVFANDSLVLRSANAGKIEAYSKINKTLVFPCDMDKILGKPDRTQSTVTHAKAQLNTPNERFKYAQFWFVKSTNVDEIAFNNLSDGKISEAMHLWISPQTVCSLQNLFICALINENFLVAINNYAIPLYNQYFEEFRSIIDSSSSLSKEDAINNIVNELGDSGVDFKEIYYHISDPIWKSIISSGVVLPLISQLENKVAEASAVEKTKDAKKSLRAGKDLVKLTKVLLPDLINLLSDNDTRCQLLADKIANTILQCGITYYNNTDDDFRKKINDAFLIQNFALSIAKGNLVRKRCEDNVNILIKQKSKLPPDSVIEFHRIIQAEIIKFKASPTSFTCALNLLKNTVSPLVSIKEILGSNNNYYIETSTSIAEMALGECIQSLNVAQEEEGINIRNSYSRSGAIERLKNAFIAAWRITSWIDVMNVSKEFRQERHEPNKQTLEQILNNVDAFSSSIFSNSVFKGCCLDIRVSNDLYKTESEIFNSCRSRSDYELFVKKFPNSKYCSDARKKIELLKQQEEDDAYRNSRSKNELRYFISKYPGSKYVQEAKDKIAIIEKREIEVKEREQANMLNELKNAYSFDRCREIYMKYKGKVIDISPASNMLYSTCRGKDYYERLCSILSSDDKNYKKAREKLNSYESLENTGFIRGVVVVLIIHVIWGIAFHVGTDGRNDIYEGMLYGLFGWAIGINYLAYVIINFIIKKFLQLFI